MCKTDTSRSALSEEKQAPGAIPFSPMVSKMMTSTGLPGKPLILSNSVILQLKKLNPKVTQVRNKARTRIQTPYM